MLICNVYLAGEYRCYIHSTSLRLFSD